MILLDNDTMIDISWIEDIDYCVMQPFTRWLEHIDKYLGKPAYNDLIVLWWFAWIWKTEMAYFLARKNSALGNKTMFLSLELPKKDMIMRTVWKRHGFNKYKSQTTEISPELEKKMMDMTLDMMADDNIEIISPDGAWWIDEIERRIEEGNDMNFKIFIIDNLWKISWDANENTRFEEISSRLQDIKNKHNICIILLHHLKKPTDKKDQYRIWGISWFRWSQKVIDNATQVIEIWRNKDPEMWVEINCTTLLLQYKDTWFGNSWRAEFRFDKWEYVQENPFYDNPF